MAGSLNLFSPSSDQAGGSKATFWEAQKCTNLCNSGALPSHILQFVLKPRMGTRPGQGQKGRLSTGQKNRGTRCCGDCACSLRKPSSVPIKELKGLTHNMVPGYRNDPSREVQGADRSMGSQRGQFLGSEMPLSKHKSPVSQTRG